MTTVIKAFVLLGATGLGGAALAGQIGQISAGYVEETNLVRPGGIIQTTTLSNRGQDAGTCRQLCDANTQCGAYRYEQASSTAKPVCYQLLTALPGPSVVRATAPAKVQSGTKVTYYRDVLKMWPYANKVLTGARPLRQFANATNDPVACFDACWRDASCQSASFVPQGTAGAKRSMCVLYSDTGTLVAQPGVLSGLKGGPAKTAPVLKRPGQKPLKPALPQ